MKISTCEKCVKRCQFFDTKRFDLCTSFLSYGKARVLQSKRDKLLVPKKPINKATSLTYKPFKELLKHES